MERGLPSMHSDPVGEPQSEAPFEQPPRQRAQAMLAHDPDQIQFDWAGSGQSEISSQRACPACRAAGTLVHFVHVMAKGERLGSYHRCTKCQSLLAAPSGPSSAHGPYPTISPECDFHQYAELLWQLQPSQIHSYCEFGPGQSLTLRFAEKVLGWQGTSASFHAHLTAIPNPGQSAPAPAQRPAGFPFDLVVAFHTLEQTNAPDALLALMKSCMGAWSSLLITCQDGALIQPGQRFGEGLRALGAPHLRPVLYSRAGLEASLARQDFPWHEVQLAGKILVAKAAFARPPLRAMDPVPQANVAQFLRAASAQPGSVSPCLDR